MQVSLTRTAMWLLALPRVEGDRRPAGVDRAALAPWWITMDSAWGVLRRLGPDRPHVGHAAPMGPATRPAGQPSGGLAAAGLRRVELSRDAVSGVSPRGGRRKDFRDK